MISLVMTVIGQDRPGLVSALSKEVAALGGSWLESRMVRLAGKFAGVVLVSTPPDTAERLMAALRALESQGLRVTVDQGGGEAPLALARSMTFDLVGQDRPGIVRDVSRALADLGVSIIEIETHCLSGSWSGESLFRATSRVSVPATVSIHEVRAAIEALADELMVDIVVDDAKAPRAPTDPPGRP